MTPPAVRRSQTLERKAAFIHQVAGRDFDEREAEDIGEQVLSFAEIKALATGDPLILEKAGVDADVARLTRLERAHADDQHRLRRAHEAALSRASRASGLAARLEGVLDRVVDTRGDRFAMTVDGQRHTKRVDTGSHLQRLLLDRLDRTPPESAGPVVEVGTLAGLTVTGQAITTIEDEILVAVPDAQMELRYTALDWKRSEPSSLITRLERQIQRLPDTHAGAQAEAEEARGEAERAESRLGAPWDRADELIRLRRRQQEIDEQLAEAASKTPDSNRTPPAGRPSGSEQLAEAVSKTADSPARPMQPSPAAQITARLDAIQTRPAPGGGISR